MRKINTAFLFLCLLFFPATDAFCAEKCVDTQGEAIISYGISMPFNNVTVRLNYRIVAKNNNRRTMNNKTVLLELLRRITTLG